MSGHRVHTSFSIVADVIGGNQVEVRDRAKAGGLLPHEITKLATHFGSALGFNNAMKYLDCPQRVELTAQPA